MQMFQDEREITLCRELVARLRPVAILEIGSAKGGTLGEWLKTGAAHVVSIDANHRQLDRDGLERIRQPWQQIHLVTGRSDHADTISRLDALMGSAGIREFDVAYIDGGHGYQTVKLDFATCRARTAKAILLNDPLLVDVSLFLDELKRTHPAQAIVSVVNPNRRLPCAGTHTCGSDYLAETGGGNVVVLLDDRYQPMLDDLRVRVETELVPADPDFRPTRTYFHTRGLTQSPAYAAYWNGMYPSWGSFRKWLFTDAWKLYEQSQAAQREGRLEESLRLAHAAKSARARWVENAARRMLRTLRRRQA